MNTAKQEQHQHQESHELDHAFLSHISNFSGRKSKSVLHWALKRSMDVTASLILLTILLPFLLLIAVIIKLTSEGPIFFIQRRVGENFKTFKILKFRTMYLGSEHRPFAIYDAENQIYIRPTAKEDKRVTWIGRYLREWSLDELPQLVNILRGDMSFVGPRPLSVHESIKVSPEFRSRYTVPAGLTGLAQVTDRMTVISDSRFKNDIVYVLDLSTLNDLKIVMRTFAVIRQSDQSIRTKNRKDALNNKKKSLVKQPGDAI